MGTTTPQLASQGGIGGSAAFPVRPDNAAPVGGSSQMQGGHASGNTSAQTPLKFAICQIVGTASYATGGETVNWTGTGFDSIVAVIPVGIVCGATLRVLEYDHVNSKAIIRVCGGAAAVLAEVANASDQTAASFRCLVIGT